MNEITKNKILSANPSLEIANLREADLLDANLREADLRDADLRGANLRDADLRWADLRRTDLRGADLRGADLGDADLGGIRSDILLSVSQIGLEYRIINYNISDDRIYCGCWKGSIKEFEDRVEKVYGKVDRDYTEYNAAILYFRMISEYRKNAGIVKIAE
jgi:hypothetical protein